MRSGQGVFQWRWDESESAYQRMVGLEPANANVRMLYALLCSFHGRHEEASQQAEMGLELDALDPMTNFHVVQSVYYGRRFEEAVRMPNCYQIRRGVLYTRWYIAWSLLALGTRDEAGNAAIEAKVLVGRQPLNLAGSR